MTTRIETPQDEDSIVEAALFARIISSEYLNALVDFFESRCSVIPLK
jgi:hypothetical protein